MRTATLTVAVLLALLSVVLSVTYILGVWPSEDGNVDWADRLERIRNVAIILGGIAAFGFAYWRGKTADRQATAAQKQVDTALQQADAARKQVQTSQPQADIAQQSVLNERYQKGAEMLGNTVLSVRIGGIVALERLALGHPLQYHAEVMKLLFAFIRQPIEDPQARSVPTLNMRGARQDVQAAIDTVRTCRALNRTVEANSIRSIDLRGADLRQADLTNLDLSVLPATESHGVASGALSASTGATVLSHADLSGAHLYDARMPYCLCDETNFTGAQLGRAEMLRARFYLASLQSTSLDGANLTAVVFARSDLHNATFKGADLSGAQFAEKSPGSAGLTQRQLDEACADPDAPPNLAHVVDAETGKPLVWRGKECEKSSEN